MADMPAGRPRGAKVGAPPPEEAKTKAFFD